MNETKWVTLPGHLPPSGIPVFLDIGEKYPIRAMWAAKHTVEAGDDDLDWADYEESSDMYYAPEGWYEWNCHEEKHWSVNGTIVAWMYLPDTLSRKDE